MTTQENMVKKRGMVDEIASGVFLCQEINKQQYKSISNRLVTVRKKIEKDSLPVPVCEQKDAFRIDPP